MVTPTLDDLLVFASDRPDEGNRASALIHLVPRLPAERLDAVLDVAFTDEHQRTRVMDVVLARATPALSVPDPEDRARRLLEVAAVLPEGDRAAALSSAWAAVVTMPPGLGQGVVFEELVSLLPLG